VQDRDRVFDRFYQIPARDNAGCGLGLAIAREICALHQAEISILEPASNRGTLVRVTLMANAPHAALSPMQSPTQTQAIPQ
jgi:two-component system, OmpR family, sensor histidine kinase TctE